MIAAHELRLGNWVNDLNGKHCRIESIDNDGCDVYFLEHDTLAYLPIKNINPIPLTPEILDKCGFEFYDFLVDDFEDDENDFIYKAWRKFISDWVYYTVNLEPNEINFKFGISRNITSSPHNENGFSWAKCQYLHNLQNIFFSLEGEEINYNP